MKKIRAFYIKTLINTEMDFEYLTEEEQIELITKLIQDHNISYPNEKKTIMIINHPDMEYNGSLDW